MLSRPVLTPPKLAAVIAAHLALAPALAFAEGSGSGLEGLTKAVVFTEVSTAVLAIAGTLAAVFVTMRGAKLVLSMIRGR